MNASYWYRNTYGLTIGWQRTWGPANPISCSSTAAAPTTNPTATPSSSRPMGALRQGHSLQRPSSISSLACNTPPILSSMAAPTNYDGAGTNASDNNTLLLFAWMIF